MMQIKFPNTCMYTVNGLLILLKKHQQMYTAPPIIQKRPKKKKTLENLYTHIDRK